MRRDSCCGASVDEYAPMCVFTEGSVGPYSTQFSVPEGGWAEIHVDGELASGTKLCVVELVCFCGKPEKHIPLVINGKRSGIRAGCSAAVIPKGGNYYLQYDGSDIDFDVVVIPHENVSDLLAVVHPGACV